MISTISNQHSSPYTITPSQNTAPVIEFRCLYTRDLQRKKKRWQDGFLKFHTFNHRAMVYDNVRNFVGDCYVDPTTEIQEGVDLELNVPVLVEVTEKIGTTTTNLAPIFQRKRNATPNKPRPTPTPAPARTPIPTNGPIPAQMRHRPLSSLLGTPTGRHGRAMLPVHSPYAQRHQDGEGQPAEESARKRQRVEEPVWSITRVSKPSKTPLRESNRLPTSALGPTPLRVKKTKATPLGRPAGLTRSQRTLAVKEVIDILSSDSELSQPPAVPPPRVALVRSGNPPQFRGRTHEFDEIEEFPDIEPFDLPESNDGQEQNGPQRDNPPANGRKRQTTAPKSVSRERTTTPMPARKNTKPIRLVSEKRRPMFLVGSDGAKPSVSRRNMSDASKSPPSIGDESLSQALFDIDQFDLDGTVLDENRPPARTPDVQPTHKRNVSLSLSQEPAVSPKPNFVLKRSRSDMTSVRTGKAPPRPANQPPIFEAEENAPGPWSIEALYLFDWRPPGFTEEQEARGDVEGLQQCVMKA